MRQALGTNTQSRHVTKSRSAFKPFCSSCLPHKTSSSRAVGPTSAPSHSRRACNAAALSLLAFPSMTSMSTASSLAVGADRRSVAAAATGSASGVAGNPANRDLLVVGPGVLGSVLAKEWLASVPGGTATGLTNTDKTHDRLRAMGITPATRTSLPEGKRYSFVAFSAPPSGSADYVADVKAALALWDGTGSFVFTSSMSVCAVDDGGRVTDEQCPLVPVGAGASTDRLLGAEQAVLQAGGNVLRLVGLYHKTRGAHTFFMKAGDVARPGGYVVNLLHYEDAAGLAAAILRGDGTGPFRGRAFMGTDGHPVSFADMMEACFSTGAFPRTTVNFTGSFPEGGTTGRGKAVDNSATRAALGGWAPRYASFRDFMAAGAQDFYSTSGLF